MFHVILAPEGLPMALALVALEGYLGFGVYWSRFASVFQP
jgi:hypothetical protein